MVELYRRIDKRLDGDVPVNQRTLATPGDRHTKQATLGQFHFDRAKFPGAHAEVNLAVKRDM